MTIDDKALELVKEFLSEKKTSYERDYQITMNDRDTGESIIVWVYKRETTIIKELNNNIKRYVPIASGNACPACGGTGRL